MKFEASFELTLSIRYFMDTSGQSVKKNALVSFSGDIGKKNVPEPHQIQMVRLFYSTNKWLFMAISGRLFAESGLN